MNKAIAFGFDLILRTQDGTATGRTAGGDAFAAGEDFKHRPGLTVDFSATTEPAPSQSPIIRIAQDQIDEDDETFTYTVTLVGTPHAVIVKGTGTVTIEMTIRRRASASPTARPRSTTARSRS